MKTRKPVKLWVVRGPAGGVAPYYGIAWTRKDLVQKLGGSVPMGCRLVRVTVSESAL